MTRGHEPAGLARSISEALRAASAMPIPTPVIDGCLQPDEWATDAFFARAYRDGLHTLPADRRSGSLSGTTGHVGESVIAVILNDLGYELLWQFTGPSSGGHGVDLIILSPDGRVVAVEVKATLRPGRWPRPSRGEVSQMSGRWLDAADNPGMSNLDLTSGDVLGAVAVVNFAAAAWRCVLTSDFSHAVAVTTRAQLTELRWLK